MDSYKRTLIALQFQRSMLCSVLADMCTKGMKLDAMLVSTLYKDSVEKRNELAEKLYTLTGGVNLSSNKQLAEYLYDVLGFEVVEKTAKGAPSTSIGTINELVPKNEKQKEFLELYSSFNKVDQLLTKYLTLFNAIVEENDGLLFGDISQGTTATHRFSSSGVPFKSDSFKRERQVQLQNIPRDLKRLFVPKREGWSIGECDGAQLEFRVAAALAQDPVAIKEIHDMVDIHSCTAEFFGCSRQDAKKFSFGPLYGGNGSTKKERDYAKFFRKKYAAIAKMQNGWCNEVVSSPERKLVLPYGMVYNFPNSHLQADGYISGSTNIYNFGVQGLATAEIIPVSLAYMWHNLPDGIEIVNTIHDSIICEVRNDMHDAWLKLCIQSMTFAVYDFFERVYGYPINVPLGLGAKLGERWGAGDERTFQVENGSVVEIVKVNGKKEKIPWNG